MDENVMRVLQMLQDGKISANEAETLIAALRGQSAPPEEEKKPEEAAASEEKSEAEASASSGRGRIDLDELGEKISQAVSRLQPEKLAQKIQEGFRQATRAGQGWSGVFTSQVRSWTEGSEQRPANKNALPEQTDTHTLEFHLDPEARINVENPFGNVKVTAGEEGPATVLVTKTVWSASANDLAALLSKIETSASGTDNRLEVKISGPEGFRDGTVDLEIKAPARLENLRAATRFGTVEAAGMEGAVEASATTGAVSLNDIGGSVKAETRSGEIHLGNVGGPASVATQSGDIKVQGSRQGLKAHTASGDVHASDIEGGSVECRSVSGDVELERAGSGGGLTISVEAISGDLKVRQTRGDLSFKSVSGDIKAEELNAESLQSQTVSGDMSLSLSSPFEGSMQLHTVSGDVTVSIPEGSSVRASLSTTSGSLRCEQDASKVTSTRTLWSGEVGEGKGALIVHTVSGDARLLRSTAVVEGPDSYSYHYETASASAPAEMPASEAAEPEGKSVSVEEENHGGTE